MKDIKKIINNPTFYLWSNDLDNIEFDASNKNVEKIVQKYIRQKKNTKGLGTKPKAT